MRRSPAERQKRYRARRKSFIDSVRRAYTESLSQTLRQLPQELGWRIRSPDLLGKAREALDHTISNSLQRPLTDQEIVDVLTQAGHRQALVLYHEILSK